MKDIIDTVLSCFESSEEDEVLNEWLDASLNDRIKMVQYIFDTAAIGEAVWTATGPVYGYSGWGIIDLKEWY